MGTLYISAIMICRVAQHLCNKRTSNCISNMRLFFKYSAFRQLLSSVLGLVLIFISQSEFKCNFETILISSFSGLMLVSSIGFSLSVLKMGTVALSSMFATAGLLVPCIAGIFLFNETMSASQWCGVGLFFLAAYFLISSSSKIYCKFSFKLFLLLLGVLLSNGFTMLSQLMFARYVPDGNVSVFSFFSFAIGGMFMLILSFVTVKNTESGEVSKFTPKLLGLGAVLSIAVFIINQLATMAAAIVSPVILFTFINGGSTIIGAVVAAVFFHEKLTTKSVIGIIIGVLSMIIIKKI